MSQPELASFETFLPFETGQPHGTLLTSAYTILVSEIIFRILCAMRRVGVEVSHQQAKADPRRRIFKQTITFVPNTGFRANAAPSFSLFGVENLETWKVFSCHM